jgi:hypothetical protein
MAQIVLLVVALFLVQAYVMLLFIQHRGSQEAPVHMSMTGHAKSLAPPRATEHRPMHVSVSNSPAPPPYRVYQSPRRVHPDFRQVGFVYSEDKSLHTPLYGRPAPRNPTRFQYYTRSHSADISVGIRRAGRDCMSDIGCEELQSEDIVTADELTDATLRVKIYDGATTT